MRKPEEIKKGLECCKSTKCEECPYDGSVILCANLLWDEVTDYIRLLEKRLARMTENAQILDAALRGYQRRDEDEDAGGDQEGAGVLLRREMHMG